MSSANIQRLDELLNARSADRNSAIKTALLKLSTELKERVKHCSAQSFDFFSDSLRSLLRLQGKSHLQLRMDCLFSCVDYFYHEGPQAKGIEAANALCVVASASGDLSWMRKGHTAAGCMLADMGRPAEALEHHAKSLSLSQQLGDVEAQVRALINTGVALNYAGLFQEAIPCFRRAISLTGSIHNRDKFRSTAFTNLAQSYLYLGEHRDGFVEAVRAVEGLTPPETAAVAFSYVVKEFTFVQLALELGKLSAAREHSQACAKYALLSDSQRAKAISDMANGLCEIHGGNTIRGLETLQRVFERTSTTDSWRLDALVALVRANDAINRPEDALKYMRALLDHVRGLREKVIATAFSTRLTGQVGAGSDLRALELHEARLEARVAERESQSQRMELFERLAVAADLKGEISGEHGYRVGRLASLLSGALGVGVEDCRAIDLAARLHDIGKIAMPDRILLTSAQLQEAERHFISTHTTIGAELLGKSNIPQLRMAEEIARHHHEWWNGEGYPSKLKGKRIPIHARIVALADVFDALTHGRPFSPPWPIDKALDEIRARKGTQFDPELTDLFLDLIDQLRKEHPDLDAYLGQAGRNSPFLQARTRIRQMLAEEREHEKKATVEGNETRH